MKWISAAPLLLLLPFLIKAENTYFDNIFILAGQSNMVGFGGIKNGSATWDGIVPPQCAPNTTGIFRLNGNFTWEVANEPLHRDIFIIHQNCGIGPGMPFANVINERAAGTIGLVPCALGGTAIEAWQRGEPTYEDMIGRAKFAALSGNIKAFLWYQGESNTYYMKDVKDYETMMVNLFAAVRSDLNLPHLPVIQVALASGGPYMETIRIMQKGLHLPNVSCVDAKGLELISTNQLHLTTSAQVRLGQMMAEEYISKYLTPPKTPDDA